MLAVRNVVRLNVLKVLVAQNVDRLDGQRVFVLQKGKARGRASPWISTYMSSAQEVLGEREAVRREPDGEGQAFMKECKRRIAWALYLDIGESLSARRSAMEVSEVSPPE